MELAAVELSALAADVVEDLRSAQPERDVEVTIDPNVWARGDQEMLRVALQNLLDNAFKFTANSNTPECNSVVPPSPARPLSSSATTAWVST